MQAQQAEWWLSEVEATVARLVGEGADAKKQQEAIDKIANEFGDEAAAVAARQLAEARWDADGDKEGEGEGGASFQDEKAKADHLPPVLSTSSPRDSAREFARRYCFRQGMLAVYYHQGSLVSVF